MAPIVKWEPHKRQVRRRFTSLEVNVFLYFNLLIKSSELLIKNTI